MQRITQNLMAEEKQPEPPRRPKRKVLFVVGILLGLLFGALVTLLLVDWFNYKAPTVVKVLERTPQNDPDTVVRYVIKNKSTQEESVTDDFMPDSLTVDSAFMADDSQDLILEEDDLDDWQDGSAPQQDVMTDKMMRKISSKVVYFDNNKREQAPPANATTQIQVQQWSTPIKNRLSYNFSGNVLKIKGMDVDNLKVVNYKNNFYAVAGKHVYLLKPNDHFDRMNEVVDVSFPFN